MNEPCSGHLSHLVLPGCRADAVVYAMQEIARSKTDFLSHIDTCPGANMLLKR